MLLILLLAGFLRLWRITTLPPGLYRDEAMNGTDAVQALETGQFRVFYPANNGREGLYINVAAVFLRLGGVRPWVLRLPAAVFGILTVLSLYLFGTEDGSRSTGLLAAFFLATCFWHVNFSRIALRAIAAPLFLAFALYLLLVAIRHWRDGGAWVSMAVFAGVVYGLGFYTYIAYRATPLLVAGVLYYRARKAGRLQLLYASAAALVSAPLAWYFLRHPGTFWGRTSQLSVFGARHPALEVIRNVWRTARMFFTHGDYNWRHNVAWRAELFWPVAILFALGTLLVLARRTSSHLALGWLATAAIPVVFSSEGVPHALRSLLMAPAACLLAAIGAEALYRWLAVRMPRPVLTASSALFLLALAWEPYHTYFDVWARSPEMPRAFDEGTVQVAEQINRLPPETPKYVVTADPMLAQPVIFLTGRDAGVRYEFHEPCTAVRARIPGAAVFCLP